MKLNLDDYALKLDVSGPAIDGNLFDHAFKESLDKGTLVRKNKSFTFMWTGMVTDKKHLRVIGKLENSMIDMKLLAIHIFSEVGTMYQTAYSVQSKIELLPDNKYAVNVEVL